VLGPSDCIKARVKDRVRRHLMVKAPPEAAMGELLDTEVRALGPRPGVSIAIDVDCRDLM
jgi:primosomal protein N' (replication factor Y)